MPSQLPGLALWSCYDGTECGDIEEYNFNINTIAAELFSCVTALDANTIVNDSSYFTSPQAGDSYVKADGCMCVYMGPVKGWICNPPVCGRMVFDSVNNATYVWDGTTWKQIITCETVTSNTIADKIASAYPSGTLGYNDTVNPWVEYQTINGLWQATGRLFDSVTCEFTYLLTKEQIEDCLLFCDQPVDVADPNKPALQSAVAAGKIGLFFSAGKIWKQDENGSLSYVLCQSDQLIPCYADSVLAEAGYVNECLEKQDGLIYFDITEKRLKICKDGVWVDATDTSLDCTDYFATDLDQSGYLAKLGDDGKLDPCFICSYPTAENSISYEAKVGTPVGGERYYNSETGRVLVYDGVAGAWRDEAQATVNECFIANQNVDIGFVGGALTAGVWTTREFNVVRASASWASLLAPGQIELTGGCCYMIRSTAEHNRSSASALRIYDVTNGLTIAQGNTSFSDTEDTGASTSEVCAEFCVTSDTTIEVQHVTGSNIGGVLAGGRPLNSAIASDGNNYAKIEISKKRDI